MNSIKVKEFKELIDYIIVEPLDDTDSKRAFRYPFYSCELLCCDNVKVMDMFFPKNEESFEVFPAKDNKSELSEDDDVLAKPETIICADDMSPIHFSK